MSDHTPLEYGTQYGDNLEAEVELWERWMGELAQQNPDAEPLVLAETARDLVQVTYGLWADSNITHFRLSTEMNGLKIELGKGE